MGTHPNARVWESVRLGCPSWTSARWWVDALLCIIGPILVPHLFNIGRFSSPASTQWGVHAFFCIIGPLLDLHRVSANSKVQHRPNDGLMPWFTPWAQLQIQLNSLASAHSRVQVNPIKLDYSAAYLAS